MKKIMFIIFLSLNLSSISKAQLEVGAEIGHYFSNYLTPISSSAISSDFSYLGIKIGLFAEQDILPFFALRFSAFYNHRHYNPNKILGQSPISNYINYHTITFPIKAVFKAGKVFQIGLGPDPMLLVGSATSTGKTEFHIGVCGEISFRIREIMRLSFFCNYDFIPATYANYPKYYNFVIGAGFAVRLKKFKKKRILRTLG